MLSCGRRVFLAALAVLAISGCSQNEKEENAIRVGWQTAWATQAQLSLTLQKTNILKSNQVDATFVPFNYGAPMAEAAISGELEFAFVGDQPAVSIMSRSEDWVPVARLMDFRVGIVVPPTSDEGYLGSIKKHRIGIPFGSSAHRETFNFLEKIGLDSNKADLVNLDITEQGEIVRAGKWGEFSMFAAWDPHIEKYQSSNYAKTLIEGKALGVVMARKSFIKANPEILAKFIESFKEAYWFYNQNIEEANKWYVEFSQVSLDSKTLNAVASFESNLGVLTRDLISVELTSKNIAQLQSAADFAFNNKLIKTKVSVQDRMKL